MGSFCNTIDLLYSPYLSLKTLWSSFEWPLRTGFTVQRYSISKVQRVGWGGKVGGKGGGEMGVRGSASKVFATMLLHS